MKKIGAQKSASPRVGLFACFSGGSNGGSLTAMAALEVVKRLAATDSNAAYTISENKEK